MSDEGKSAAREVASLVPEVYFDLISRVPAGMCLILAIGTDDLSPWRLSLSTLNGWTFALLFGAAYAAGLLLTGLASHIQLRYQTLLWLRRLNGDPAAGANVERLCAYLREMRWPEQCQYVLEASGSRSKPLLPLRRKNELNTIRRQLHDHLKATIPDAKALLAKMSGEAALFTNLQIAVLVYATLHWFWSLRLSGPLTVDWEFCGFIAIVLIMLGIGAGNREGALASRELSYLSLWMRDKEPPAPPAQRRKAGGLDAVSAAAASGLTIWLAARIFRRCR